MVNQVKKSLAMTPRRRVFLLVLIMTSITLVVETITIYILYLAHLEEEKARLSEMVRHQASLIKSIYESNYKDNDRAIREEILNKLIRARSFYKPSSGTEDFVVAERKGNDIVFLLHQHHSDYMGSPETVPINWSKAAGPARLALTAQPGYGAVIALDYRMIEVIAAYEFIPELAWAVIAKVDLEEVQRPFIKASLLSGSLGLVAVIIGSVIFVRVTTPIIRKLDKTDKELTKTLAVVNRLSGLLPICASCKKIRDDNGYWNEIEAYIKEYSDAEFSHGICPDCARRLYPNLIHKPIGGETHEL